MSLNVYPLGSGIVTRSGAYNENSTITVNAVANTGYHFVKWTENNNEISNNASLTFNINSNRSLVAIFEKDTPAINQYVVSIKLAPSGSGIVTGADTYNKNSKVTIKATANTGYHFVKWIENNNEISNNASLTFNINSNRSLVAIFEKDDHHAPKTGDNNHIGIYTIITIVSGTIAILAKNRSKKKIK